MRKERELERSEQQEQTRAAAFRTLYQEIFLMRYAAIAVKAQSKLGGDLGTLIAIVKRESAMLPAQILEGSHLDRVVLMTNLLPEEAKDYSLAVSRWDLVLRQLQVVIDDLDGRGWDEATDQELPRLAAVLILVRNACGDCIDAAARFNKRALSIDPGLSHQGGPTEQAWQEVGEFVRERQTGESH